MVNDRILWDHLILGCVALYVATFATLAAASAGWSHGWIFLGSAAGAFLASLVAVLLKFQELNEKRQKARALLLVCAQIIRHIQARLGSAYLSMDEREDNDDCESALKKLTRNCSDLNGIDTQSLSYMAPEIGEFYPELGAEIVELCSAIVSLQFSIRHVVDHVEGQINNIDLINIRIKAVLNFIDLCAPYMFKVGPKINEYIQSGGHMHRSWPEALADYRNIWIKRSAETNGKVDSAAS